MWSPCIAITASTTVKLEHTRGVLSIPYLRVRRGGRHRGLWAKQLRNRAGLFTRDCADAAPTSGDTHVWIEHFGWGRRVNIEPSWRGERDRGRWNVDAFRHERAVKDPNLNECGSCEFTDPGRRCPACLRLRGRGVV